MNVLISSLILALAWLASPSGPKSRNREQCAMFAIKATLGATMGVFAVVLAGEETLQAAGKH
jgi:hypothetical protein